MKSAASKLMRFALQPLACLLVGFGVADGASAFETESKIEQAPFGTVSEGEYYLVAGRRIYLERAKGMLAVGLREESADLEGDARSLTAAGSVLSRFKLRTRVARIAIFEATAAEGAELPAADAASTRALITALARNPRVRFATPVFVNAESRLQQILTDEIIVRLRPGATLEQLREAAPVEIVRTRRLGGTTDQHVLQLADPGDTRVLEAANAIYALPFVAWAEPNFLGFVRKDATPDDPQYPNQWHLHNWGQTGARVDADIDAPEAWDATTGHGCAIIAVLDDGVEINHPDLKGNIAVNPGEDLNGNGIVDGENLCPGTIDGDFDCVDSDNNGYVDDIAGWDFTADIFPPGDSDANPSDPYDNHGTSVAGVAAAVANNTENVAGAAWSCGILPVKVIRGEPSPLDVDDMAKAIYYASGRSEDALRTWRGADILSMSLGLPGPSGAINSALDYAANDCRRGRGCPFFKSAGNNAVGSFFSFSYDIPGPYPDPSADWYFEWHYEKDAGGSAGDDTAWLAYVELPDGTVERFDVPEPPAGWDMNPPGSDEPWIIEDDPAHAYGVGRYQARAGQIGDNQVTKIRSPTVTVTGPSKLKFHMLVSSEYAKDKVKVTGTWVGNTTTTFWSNWSGVYGGENDCGYPGNYPSTICVGASTDWDYRASYSQYGPALDFVAPSNGGYAGITTTDRTGDDGYEPGAFVGDVTSSFGGTSSATPLAAGVAALLLSKNYDLTAADIRQILRDTADEIGGVTYAYGTSPFYGHGRINAKAALDAVPAVAPPFSPDCGLCGNGVVEGAEECDDGNTENGDCCSSTCQEEPGYNPVPCRVAAGVCDLPEVKCTAVPNCPADGFNFRPASTLCRAAAGVCDLAETCTGASASCPADAFEPATTVCRALAGACDVAAETCTGAGAACPADAFEPATTECRAAAGTCDAAEKCTGAGPDCPADEHQPDYGVCRLSAGPCDLPEVKCPPLVPSCPADAFEPATTVCRDVAGICDVAEYCDGASPSCPWDEWEPLTQVCRLSAGGCDPAEVTCYELPCPADALDPATTVCRAAAGVCDVAEMCTGTGASCPADVYLPDTSMCRDAAGDCDVAEACTGSGASCPADAHQPNYAVCRPSAGVCDPEEVRCYPIVSKCPPDAKSTRECRAAANQCDVAERCDGAADHCPADAHQPNYAVCRPAAKPCDKAEVNCPPIVTACPGDAWEPGATVCRAAVGACDVLEMCTGTSVDCPANDYQPVTTECRAAADLCDIADYCDGASPICPPDLWEPGTTVCRAVAGVCDVAEVECPPVVFDCPPDAYEPETAECRAVAGVCDVAELCTGMDATCPADAYEAETTECRVMAGVCDMAEMCTGADATCPADAFEPPIMVCRGAIAACDMADNCDGASVFCPPDAVQPATTLCRGAIAACDIGDNCDGASAICPPDAIEPPTTVCRAAAGVCDLAENCDGLGYFCPPDAIEPSTTVCRADAGDCDVAEKCSGAAKDCPDDAFEPEGTLCDDGYDYTYDDQCDDSGFCRGVGFTELNWEAFFAGYVGDAGLVYLADGDLAGGGVAELNYSAGVVPAHLSRLRLVESRGNVAGTATVWITDPEVAGNGVLGVIANATLGSGTFAPISGGAAPTGALEQNVLPVRGLAKLCILSTACTLYVGLPFSGLTTVNGVTGIRGVGVGGLMTAGGYGGIHISLKAAPWTIKTTTALDQIETSGSEVVFTPRTAKGWAHAPASTTTSTAQPSGVVQLVTPGQIVTNLPLGTSEKMAAFAILTIHFIPEPGLLLLLGSGVVGLILLGRRRIRG